MNNIEKNILVLVEHAGQGGAEKIAAVLAQTVAKNKNYKVYYCSLYQPASMPSIPGVIVSTLGIQSGGGLLGRMQRYLSVIVRLRDFKIKHNIVLTISNLWPTDWINRFSGKENKIAIIHTTILHSHHNRLMVKARRLVSFVYRGMNKVVLVSGNLKPELTRFFGVPDSKIQVIYNPVDIARAAQLAAETPNPALAKLFSQNRVLTTIGRLSHGKNIEALLRIHKRLQHLGVKLLIVGEGEEKAALEATAQAEGLSCCDVSDTEIHTAKEVFFAPFQKNIFALLARTEVFLFPTRSEGFGLVLVEAMSCGCPAVASDCPSGAIAEIMESKTPFQPDQPRKEADKATGGYLMPVPEESITDELWMEKITELLLLNSEAREDLSVVARRRATDFDISHFEAKWHELIATILHEQK